MNIPTSIHGHLVRVLVWGLCAAPFVLSTTAHATPGWTPWVSEENGGPSTICGPSTEAARGFDCDGGYCDDVRVYCDTLPFGITVSDWKFSGFFSEEDSGFGTVTSEGWYRYDNSYSHVCYYSGAAGIMTGIRCSGSNCDNISVECGIPQTHFGGVAAPVEYRDCYWTDYVSEEDAALMLYDEEFITGVECSGSYCDDKRFYVCSVQAAANSCGGECGGQARGGCWCDVACSTYGDCCSDYASVC
ncbi:hypothetical protein ACNOYE_27480 [Nannocystaceae bacterium ST9]